jgi:hypothetical protein
MSDFNTGVYDDDDFPELLADGIVEEDDGGEYEYSQTITVGDATLAYGQDDDYGDDPVFYFDLDAGSQDFLIYRVEMTDQLDLTDLTDSETIEMFGKTYTFDPNHDAGDDVTMYGSDVTVIISQGEPVTIEDDNGDEYTIEVLGGNSDYSTANLRVTGSSTETKSLAAGQSKNMAGLDLFVEDVFISNIGGDSISVSLFVGSNKIVIPSTAVSATESYQEIQINGEDNTEIEAWVDGADVDAIDNFYFRVSPVNFDNEDLDPVDNWNWLVEGAEWTDPLFGFSYYFQGMTPSIEGRTPVSVVRNGDVYNLAFTNNDGDEYDVEIYQGNGAAVSLADNLDLSANDLADDEIFIIEKTESDAGDSVSYIYEVRDIDDTAGDEHITIKDLGTGVTADIDHLDEIGDTGYFVNVTSATAAVLQEGAADADAKNFKTYVYAKGGLKVQLDTTLGEGANLTMTEDTEDIDETAAARVLSFALLADATDDIAMGSASWDTGDEVSDTEGDVRFGISDYGTWFEQERDNGGDYLHVYYSQTETDFNVFLNGAEAVVITSGTGTGAAYELNDLVVGQIAVYDNEAMGLIGKTPLIVVGGPCVNTAAMNLLGNPEVCTEGFTDGKAKIKFFAAKNAVLVAGYSGEDTTGACQLIANVAYGKEALTGTEVEVIVTDLENIDFNEVA